MKYRIVHYRCCTGANYLVVQFWRWYFPFWVDADGLYDDLDQAIAAINRYKNKVVWHD